MADESLPTEIEYADDTDFITSELTHIKLIKATAPTCLNAWNLAMNTEKTENTILKRECDKEDEIWMKTKKLGTFLGDSEELKRRKQLATSSMANMWKVWSRKNNKISLQKRILLYNTYITSILVCNSGTWALSKAEKRRTRPFPSQTTSIRNRHLLPEHNIQLYTLRTVNAERCQASSAKTAGDCSDMF